MIPKTPKNEKLTEKEKVDKKVDDAADEGNQIHPDIDREGFSKREHGRTHTGPANRDNPSTL